MIIVAGRVYVDAVERDAYLASCRAVVEQARVTEGCLDFALSPDPLEPDRINVFEHWASAEALAAFRGSGPDGDQAIALRRIDVREYELST